MSEDIRRRQIVELECGDCLVVISAEESWRTKDGHLKSGWVTLDLFHPGAWRYPDSIKKRISRAWAGWRRKPGDAGSVWIETMGDKSLDALILALTEAKRVTNMLGEFVPGVGYQFPVPDQAKQEEK